MKTLKFIFSTIWQKKQGLFLFFTVAIISGLILNLVIVGFKFVSFAFPVVAWICAIPHIFNEAMKDDE